NEHHFTLDSRSTSGKTSLDHVRGRQPADNIQMNAPKEFGVIAQGRGRNAQKLQFNQYSLVDEVVDRERDSRVFGVLVGSADASCRHLARVTNHDGRQAAILYGNDSGAIDLRNAIVVRVVKGQW